MLLWRMQAIHVCTCMCVDVAVGTSQTIIVWFHLETTKSIHCQLMDRKFLACLLGITFASISVITMYMYIYMYIYMYMYMYMYMYI